MLDSAPRTTGSSQREPITRGLTAVTDHPPTAALGVPVETTADLGERRYVERCPPGGGNLSHQDGRVQGGLR